MDGHVLAIVQPKKRFEPVKFASQTGTGLTFNQIACGFIARFNIGVLGTTNLWWLYLS
jgi:hypothetical protein